MTLNIKELQEAIAKLEQEFDPLLQKLTTDEWCRILAEKQVTALMNRQLELQDYIRMSKNAILQRVIEPVLHEDTEQELMWTAFNKEMQGRQYGTEEENDSRAWFEAGWKAKP